LPSHPADLAAFARRFEARESLNEEDSRNLVEVNRRIEAGSCVLFLGAGASIPAGAPSASELGEDLREHFAPDLPGSLGLRRLSDLLSARRRIDRVDIDSYVAARLAALQPVDLHQIIPMVLTPDPDPVEMRLFDRLWPIRKERAWPGRDIRRSRSASPCVRRTRARPWPRSAARWASPRRPSTVGSNASPACVNSDFKVGHAPE
jgi:hypothetical protein